MVSRPALFTQTIRDSLTGGPFWQGVRATLPFVPGVAFFGLAFGALALSNGLTAPQSLAMSVLVVAGASQFVAVQLLGDGASFLVILLATFLINLRNFLYSASLSPLLQGISPARRWLLAYFMADENYGLAINRHRQGKASGRELARFYAGVTACLILSWWTSTAVGAAGGDFLPIGAAGLLGFTGPLIFTSLVVPLLATRPALLAALTAAAVAVLLNPLPHRLGLLLGAGAGILVGTVAERRTAPGTNRVEAITP